MAYASHLLLDSAEQSGTRVSSRMPSPASRAAVLPLDEKRVRNDKMKDKLGVRLLFPTYREGLQALADGDMRPFGKPFT